MEQEIGSRIIVHTNSLGYHQYMIQQLGVTLLTALLLWAPHGKAQEDLEENKKYGFEYGIHTGPLLPNQFPDVTEIMPTWGGRIGIPYRKSILELGGTSTRAYGTSIYNAHLSYRGDVVVEGITGIFYLGLDAYYISPANSSTPYTDGGGHIGAGLMTLLGDVAWFRADMKFNINPGTALYIGFGIHFRFPEEKEDEPK